MVQTFNVNSLNELTTVTRSGTLTVAGTTTIAATKVTVNTQTACRYGDNTFAKDGFSLADGTNTFTAVAQDSAGRGDTNSSSVYLPATASFVYDLNGNLTSDGRRGFDYDDENQLIRITVTNAWKSEFTYDGRNRRRNRKKFYTYNSGWVLQSDLACLYDGWLLMGELNAASGNAKVRTYVWGTDLSGSMHQPSPGGFGSAGGAGGVGGLLKETFYGSGTNHCFVAFDGNGNVAGLVDASTGANA
jgi:YD repeat-containing protein